MLVLKKMPIKNTHHYLQSNLAVAEVPTAQALVDYLLKMQNYKKVILQIRLKFYSGQFSYCVKVKKNISYQNILTYYISIIQIKLQYLNIILYYFNINVIIKLLV